MNNKDIEEIISKYSEKLKNATDEDKKKYEKKIKPYVQLKLARGKLELYQLESVVVLLKVGYIKFMSIINIIFN
ncbi:hypothetical protein DDB_G0287433 [Dictyostelium discoideum AX4]|uniref:Uncharacterized protein n=1 Tax=Dictyostelium discoideum TaxID=44689 RepID=Q54KJ3_DICDI|nr:hypothetical protein DDB_G0287433 [Dictyostelium discoideum AX4]EAL63784.1 hypothetical protein DDB_G0287433 [Dictyostelium discoideum AX4]|eukprot:XP_637230.1 hypothetical protein DDB_G0287433 [Dictyostelium discoideum AX4]